MYVRHYMEILKNVTQNPQLNIGEIELLPAEQTEILKSLMIRLNR